VSPSVALAFSHPATLTSGHPAPLGLGPGHRAVLGPGHRAVLAVGLNGKSIDGSLYTWFTNQANSTPHWLDDVVSFWATWGLAFFALLMIACWWQARRGNPAVMAQALSVPVAVVLAYVVNDVVKSIFNEVRPCQVIPTHTLQPCPGPTDWSFPSNHSAIAAAAAIALLLIDRRLGAIAVPAALFMGFARIWVGAHYPHDVLVGFVVGALVALLVVPPAGRAAPLVARLASGPLRPLLTDG
jgi:membrane-associated phospholipid phosphatase